MIIDSHCHLNLYKPEEINNIIQGAFSNSVDIMVSICTKLSEIDAILEICRPYRNIYASVGIHPHEAHNEISATVEELIEHTKHNKIIGIGETGLDYYYPDIKKIEQIESFKKHVFTAQVTGLPLIIHSRSADEDMIYILNEEYKKKSFTAVLHCFTSSKKLFYAALDLGIYISFSGIITFKNAKEIQEVAKLIPIDKILIETDAPYLAPVPKRGEINQPAFIVHTFEYLKSIRNDANALEKAIENNFFKLFNKAVHHAV